MNHLGESRVFGKKLREIAARLTRDVELQKDLVQEMHVHLLRVCEEHPSNTMSWYLRSGEFHARNWLRQGRSIDSHKRSHSRVTIESEPGESGEMQCFEERCLVALSVGTIHAPQSEMIVNEVCDLIVARLSETQQRIVSWLMQGYGVREIAAKLGISHPAVVKHRKKIAHIASEVMSEQTPPTDRKANGRATHGNRKACAWITGKPYATSLPRHTQSTRGGAMPKHA